MNENHVKIGRVGRKVIFVQKYKDLISSFIEDNKKDIHLNKRPDKAKKIVYLARKEIGYSATTFSGDILNVTIRFYKSFKEANPTPEDITAELHASEKKLENVMKKKYKEPTSDEIFNSSPAKTKDEIMDCDCIKKINIEIRAKTDDPEACLDVVFTFLDEGVKENLFLTYSYRTKKKDGTFTKEKEEKLILKKCPFCDK